VKNFQQNHPDTAIFTKYFIQFTAKNFHMLVKNLRIAVMEFAQGMSAE